MREVSLDYINRWGNWDVKVEGSISVHTHLCLILYHIPDCIMHYLEPLYPPYIRTQKIIAWERCYLSVVLVNLKYFFNTSKGRCQWGKKVRENN